MVLYIIKNEATKITNQISFFSMHFRFVFLDKFHDLCHPCLVDYDFIGKLPSIEQDSKYIFEKTGLSDKVKFPTRSESKYAKVGADFYMKPYYSKLPKPALAKLYKAYEDDFRLFNYTLPDVIQPMMPPNNLRRKKRSLTVIDENIG